MAIYIDIIKNEETDDYAIYNYGLINLQQGSVKITKSNGEVDPLTDAEKNDNNKLFYRVQHKLKKHWEKGEYPEKTCWAS